MLSKGDKMKGRIGNEKLERINSWLKGKKQGPYKLDIFLTQACNLNCLFCDCHNISYEKLRHELNKSDFVSIINEAKELGVRNMGILGGEPFVKTGLMLDVMKTIKNNGMSGSLTTNGTIFNEDSIREIVMMGWDMMRFSVDGKRKTHDYLRGKKGTYNKVIRSLLLFKKIKKQLNKNNPSIEFNFVLTNKNYMDLPFVLKLASKVDCKRFYLLPLIELTELCSNLKINELNKKIKKYLVKASLLAEKFGIESNIHEITNAKVMENFGKADSIHRKQGTFYCLQPWYGLAVHSNGNVVPCANFDDFSGENIEGTHLKKIWYGNYMSKIRNNMKKGVLPNVCSRCCMPMIIENKKLKEELRNLK